MRRHRAAGEPDRTLLELDGDQAFAAEAPALTGNIRARIQDTIHWRTSAATHPLPLPHTGSSETPSPGANERTSRSVFVPAWYRPKTLAPVIPIEFSAASLPISGASALTASPLASWTVNHTGPTSIIAARWMSVAVMPRGSAAAVRSEVVGSRKRGSGNASSNRSP